MFVSIEGLGELLTISLLVLATGVSLILLISAILDIIERSKNREIRKR